MTKPFFDLVAVISRDGLIARKSGHNPSMWASPEEQEHFYRLVDAADWSFMGRRTHEEAPRPQRRRVIFTRAVQAPIWASPNQVLFNPQATALETLLVSLGPVRPPRNCVVLGGTAVHDWFLAQGLLDRVTLSIEPVEFMAGLPMLSDQPKGDPTTLLERRGFRLRRQWPLNAQGTLARIYER